MSILSNRYKYIVFISFEILLFFLIIFLAIQIIKLRERRVKGAQNVNILKKDNLIFDKTNDELKYFYEPKSNSIDIENPNWLGHEIKNTINADSLNERYDYPINKSTDIFRIIVIGDSFTYGAYVNTQDNYTEILEDILNKSLSCQKIKHFDVINLGVGGYDLTYSINRLKTRGIKYNPDLVIWLLNTWNFDSYNEIILPIKEDLHKTGVSEFDEKTKIYLAQLTAVNRIKSNYGENFLIDLSKQSLLKLKDVYNGNLLIISVDKYPNNINTFVYNLLSNGHFKYFSMDLNYFQNNDILLPDKHPNEKGHLKFADKLLNYLVKNNLKECKTQLKN